MGSESWAWKASSAARSLRLPVALVAGGIGEEDAEQLGQRAERMEMPKNIIGAIMGSESACLGAGTLALCLCALHYETRL